MPVKVFIDESGDIGVAKIRGDGRRGSSPYFVLGVAAIQPASEIVARATLEDVKKRIRRDSWKHATDLDHAQKTYLARELSSIHMRLFAVISNKSTLKDYSDKIGFQHQMYYNKCVKYLMEIVCGYLSAHHFEKEDVSFVLEQRNHDYNAMLRYLAKVKENPIYPASKKLSLLNPFAISTRRKGEEDCLEIADFVAHSVYQCVNKSEANFGIPEDRYFKELQGCFAAGPDKKILGVGIKCIHSVADLDLDPDISSLLLSARADRPSLKPT